MDFLSITRHTYTDKSTIGDWSVGGKPFCNSLELSCRKGDEKGLLAIPEGRYLVKQTMSPRFGKPMWEIMNVPGRTGIRIHPANRPEELDGCIACGSYDPKLPNWISSSRTTYKRLCERLNKESKAGRDIWISITGGPSPSSSRAF